MSRSIRPSTEPEPGEPVSMSDVEMSSSPVYNSPSSTVISSSAESRPEKSNSLQLSRFDRPESPTTSSAGFNPLISGNVVEDDTSMRDFSLHCFEGLNASVLSSDWTKTLSVYLMTSLNPFVIVQRRTEEKPILL
jgi:hypothetical protein